MNAPPPPPPPLAAPPLRRGSSRGSARSSTNTVFATQFPTVASVRHLFLDDQSKVALQQLFGILDKNGDGVLQAADFTMDTGPRRTQQLWLQLQQSFDQNRDGAITPLEYVDGFKALAMGQPLDMTAFARVPSTNLELLGCLQLSANVIVRNMTLQLFNTVGESLPPGAPTTPQAFWATSPTSVLLSLTGLFITDDSHKGLQKLFNAIDADKNGVLTAHDFAGKTFSSQHGAQRAQRRWALLQGAFDLNGDHQVTKEEFYTKFKELALAQPLIGFSRLPSSHTECIALLNHSTNHSIGKLAGEFVLALKNA